LAAAMNRRSFFRAVGVRNSGLMACPVSDRAMTTLLSDRRTMILSRSQVNTISLDHDRGDPV
jgi:hypothetical protein